jgi:DNA-binding MarR family transcriptional regulator
LNTNHFEGLNNFFVHVFNEILAWEEQSLKKVCDDEKITMREVHILEAVYELKKEEKNTMANIASFLAVTPASCSTSVNILVNKGYIDREYSKKDRRVIYINLTEKGERVNELHGKFHQEVMDEIGSALDEKELDLLISVLGKVGDIFKNYTRR